MRLTFIALIGLALACGLAGCTAREPEPPPSQARAAENVSPEMRGRALQALHSEDAKLQMEGIRFLESFPEVKQHYLTRVAELAKSGNDAKVRSRAAKILK